MKKLALYLTLGCVAGGLIIYGCSGGSSSSGTTGTTTSNGAPGDLTGPVVVDGSSTVEPISSAMAEEFGKVQPGVEVTVAASGTGGGFKKFCNDELDITGASRPIKDSELEACKAKGIEYIELPVAFDGLSVVVNPENTWIEDITVDELKKIWEPNSKVDSWDDVRAGFPAEKISLFGPGTDSGTFDYFTGVINGEEGASRPDYQASEDDNVLVTGVAGDKGGLGYFGYAYYVENKDKLKVLKVAGVEPNHDSIADGTYAPLSRPIFIYVKVSSLEKPQVKAFVDFYLSNPTVVGDTGYIALPDSTAELVRARAEGKTTGTVFHNAPAGKSLEDLLKGA
jgi:phosphate transport system substrate-binding protein